MKIIKRLLVEGGFEELFEKLVTFSLIHFSGDIDLCGIDLVLGEFGAELGDDLLGDFIVELLDFVEFFHLEFVMKNGEIYYNLDLDFLLLFD